MIDSVKTLQSLTYYSTVYHSVISMPLRSPNAINRYWRFLSCLKSLVSFFFLFYCLDLLLNLVKDIFGPFSDLNIISCLGSHKLARQFR